MNIEFTKLETERNKDCEFFNSLRWYVCRFEIMYGSRNRYRSSSLTRLRVICSDLRLPNSRFSIVPASVTQMWLAQDEWKRSAMQKFYDDLRDLLSRLMRHEICLVLLVHFTLR